MYLEEYLNAYQHHWRMLQILIIMENKKASHYYLLPDGQKAENMREAREKMGLGVQGFRALVRREIVKKITITSETTEYEQQKT